MSRDNPYSTFERFGDSLIKGLHVCTIARIERFNPLTMRAEVTPLVRYRTKTGAWADRPMLLDVPVSTIVSGDFLIRTPYKTGDLVVVAFADEDLDAVLIAGEMANANSSRVHAMDDAIVLGGLLSFKNSAPPDSTEDLVISTRSSNAKIKIAPDGEIEISSDKAISIKSDEVVTIEGPTQTGTWS